MQSCGEGANPPPLLFALAGRDQQVAWGRQFLRHKTMIFHGFQTFKSAKDCEIFHCALVVRMSYLFRLVCFSIVLSPMLLLQPLQAEDPSAEYGFEGPMAEIVTLHDRGAEGDKQAVRDCVAKLEKMVKSEPDNQLARVYLGSALTLLSRDLLPGPGKLEALKRGGQLMDAAVAAEPANLRVRLVRAINNLKLPRIFGRRKMAYDDFALLVRAARGGQSGLSEPELQAIYFFGGEALKAQRQKKEAVLVWNEGIALDKSSELAGRMRDALGK